MHDSLSVGILHSTPSAAWLLQASIQVKSSGVPAQYAGAQRRGQRPHQDSLDWKEAGPSTGAAQGLNVCGDADVRVVSEDKTHRVCFPDNSAYSMLGLGQGSE